MSHRLSGSQEFDPKVEPAKFQFPNFSKDHLALDVGTLGNQTYVMQRYEYLVKVSLKLNLVLNLQVYCFIAGKIAVMGNN